jgi:hypothetical protein
LTTFHHVGIDETMQFRLKPKGNLYAIAGIGAAYRLSTSYKNFDFNRIDIYANLGLKYQMKKVAIVTQFSPSLTPIYKYDINNFKSKNLFQTVQIGVEIPLK